MTKKKTRGQRRCRHFEKFIIFLAFNVTFYPTLTAMWKYDSISFRSIFHIFITTTSLFNCLSFVRPGLDLL